MRKIYDYIDIRRLRESTIHDRLKNGTIIAATSDMARALRNYYGREYQVLDIHSFITALLPEWDKEVKDIKNYVMLRSVIDTYIRESKITSNEVKSYLSRNAADMWNAIKLLVEADVMCTDIPSELSEPVTHFKHIWRRLERDNEQLASFRSIFLFDLSQQSYVMEKLQESAGTKRIQPDIFLIGFYFITPIQERIFDVLNANGFRLTYLNCHNEADGQATKIWEETFKEEYLARQNKQMQPELSSQNPFTQVLTGQAEKLSVKVHEDASELAFATYVKDAYDKGEKLYSPDAKNCNLILQEYYPELFEQKHLLSFPVGQYVYFLHMMWDTFEEEIRLDYTSVYKCFASGWLTTERYNGKDYLYEMKLLEVYFKNCNSAGEWKERLQTLLDAKEALSDFENREQATDRWHRLLGNPFSNIAVYNITEQQIAAITALIEKLIKDAEYLFAGEDQVNLYQHFNKIKKIIRDHLKGWDILQEEKEMAYYLLGQLSDETTKDVVCPMNGVRDAIILLIGNHFTREESQETETSEKVEMVKPFSMIEAELLAEDNKPIHLVMADEFAMPGAKKNLPWPLTEELLSKLNLEKKPQTRKYLQCMQSVIFNRPLSYRYLFYSYLGNAEGDVEKPLHAEWISTKQQKSVAISPYLSLLGYETVKRDQEAKWERIEQQIAESNLEIGENVLSMPSDDKPREVRMDYMMCQRRYLYSYVLNELPSFSSEFHYSFEMTQLISSFSTLAQCNKYEVGKKLAELFPFFRQIERQQASDFAKRSDVELEPINYGGVEYPPLTIKPHYLYKQIWDEATDRLDAYMEKGIMPKDVYGAMCTYCPYGHLCRQRYREEEKERNKNDHKQD